ncbi:MAG: hypothetical protein D5R97_09025 [Candidatus Syntrophonatronum acetioxidans]|uniref:Uncharacterized protein n=1 Tax=Candidatus Syntrophonatronum acetioxidans TaxID=1795816 RepID=A0A424YB97_9FIRM|nr:MAG: hypothetical protein D5R97_09025 [Candidatus Syntrophonatronum acetioxidans]
MTKRDVIKDNYIYSLKKGTIKIKQKSKIRAISKRPKVKICLRKKINRSKLADQIIDEHDVAFSELSKK